MPLQQHLKGTLFKELLPEESVKGIVLNLFERILGLLEVQLILKCQDRGGSREILLTGLYLAE